VPLDRLALFPPKPGSVSRLPACEVVVIPMPVDDNVHDHGSWGAAERLVARLAVSRSSGSHSTGRGGALMTCNAVLLRPNRVAAGLADRLLRWRVRAWSAVIRTASLTRIVGRLLNMEGGLRSRLAVFTRLCAGSAFMCPDSEASDQTLQRQCQLYLQAFMARGGVPRRTPGRSAARMSVGID
jgi:hypothetical protein